MLIMKRIGTLLFALMAALALIGAAESSAPLAVHYENHAGAPGVLSVYVNSNYGEPLTEGDFSVSLSGQTLKTLRLRGVGAENEGISWLFAIDVSGSMKGAKMDMLRQTLTALVAGLGENDNAAFLTFGDDTKATPFRSDQTELLDFIAGIETLNEDTNLYKGIVTAAQILNTDAAVHSKRCIVVFSDGEDDITEGFTREEAEKAVETSHIPVFTIAVQNQKPSDSVVESAKILAGLSRKSAGGLNQTLKPGGEAELIAANIADSIRGGYIIDLDLTDVSLPQDQSLLEIRLTVGGQNAADSLMVNSAELRAYLSQSPAEPPPKTPPTPTESAEPESAPPEPDTTESAEPEKGIGRLPFVIAGGVVLVILAAGVVALRARKKRVLAAAPETSEVKNVSFAEGPVTSAVPAPRPQWRFTFAKVGFAEADTFTFDIADELIIGRNSGQFSVPADTRLSARHCRIFSQNGVFYAEDLRSTNGTYLNGVPVAQPTRLEQDNILLIGSMELRVTWKSIEG
jgi:hypothetical protein